MALSGYRVGRVQQARFEERGKIVGCKFKIRPRHSDTCYDEVGDDEYTGIFAIRLRRLVL